MTAPLVLTQAALPGMLERGSGTVITISSYAAVTAGPMAGVAYGAAKAAVASVMKSVNNELRSHGLRACTIFPGEVDTPILERRKLVPDAAARATMMQSEDLAEIVRLCACIPGPHADRGGLRATDAVAGPERGHGRRNGDLAAHLCQEVPGAVGYPGVEAGGDEADAQVDVAFDVGGGDQRPGVAA